MIAQNNTEIQVTRIDIVVDGVTKLGDPAPRRVLRCRRLEDIRVTDVDAQTIVVFEGKGYASHVEVVCRLRGVPLVSADEIVTDGGVLVVRRHVNGTAIEFGRTFSGEYQVSVYSPDDLEDLNFEQVGSVFLRMEHILYRLSERIDLSRDEADLPSVISRELQSFAERVPVGVRLLVRGADVRSDDPVLSDSFHAGSEPNPELGLHGARWLLTHPDWLAIEAESLKWAVLAKNVSYSLPFVTRWDEWQKFLALHANMFPSPGAFLESPATLLSLESARLDIPLCIGLKDVAQFYFGADRSNSSSAISVDFTDVGLVRTVGEFVARAWASSGDPVAVHQQLSSLGAYGSILGDEAWMPSLPLGEFELLRSVE